MPNKYLEGRWEERYDSDGSAVVRERRTWERWHQHGGSGLMPSDAGRASDMSVHYALTSRFRLMLMTHLAAHGRATIPELTLLYGWPRTRLRHKLESLRRVGLGERMMLARPAARDHTRQWKRQPGFAITGEGRRWLWRFGWVSMRMCVLERDLFSHPVLPDERDRYEAWVRPRWWVDDLGPIVREDVPAAPVAALAECLQDVLLRPKPMALIVDLRWYGPYSLRDLTASLRLPQPDVNAMLRRFRALGWVEREPGVPRYCRARPRPPRWSMSSLGRDVVARHVDALRVMMSASGHEPDASDIEYPFGENEEGFEPHLAFAWKQ